MIDIRLLVEDAFDYGRLHIIAAVDQCAIACSQLDRRSEESLSEGIIEEPGIGDRSDGFDESRILVRQLYSRAFSETELIDIIVEDLFAELLGYPDHTHIARPDERMEKIPIAHAGVVSVLDRIDSHLDLARIIVRIIESDFVGIEPYSDGERLEDASRLIGHGDILIYQDLRSVDILRYVFRHSDIYPFIARREPVFASSLDIDRILDVTLIIDEISVLGSERFESERIVVIVRIVGRIVRRCYDISVERIVDQYADGIVLEYIMICLDNAFHLFLDADIYGEIDIITVLRILQFEFIGAYRADPCRSTADDLSVFSAEHIIEILFDAIERIIVLIDESHDVGQERAVLVVSLGIGFHS